MEKVSGNMISVIYIDFGNVRYVFDFCHFMLPMHI